MTEVTFFNTHPPHTIITQAALDDWVDKEVPIWSNGMMMGYAKITKATSDDNGITITYETDADLGIAIQIPTDWYGLWDDDVEGPEGLRRD